MMRAPYPQCAQLEMCGSGHLARVVKLVDTRDLKSLGLTAVPVRFRPRAPLELLRSSCRVLTLCVKTSLDVSLSSNAVLFDF